MNELDKAYLAGLIDGEGSITHTGVNPSVRLTIGNTYKPIIDWVLETFGGAVSEYQSKPTWKKCYNWHIIGSDAEPILSAVLPYLRIKREQAQVGLILIQLAAKHKRGDQDSWLLRLKVAERLSTLNKRGVA